MRALEFDFAIIAAGELILILLVFSDDIIADCDLVCVCDVVDCARCEDTIRLLARTLLSIKLVELVLLLLLLLPTVLWFVLPFPLMAFKLERTLPPFRCRVSAGADDEEPGGDDSTMMGVSC